MSASIPRTRRVVLVALAACVLPLAAASIAHSVPADPEFMTFDSTARTVQLTIIARYDDSNGGFNFNGGYRGGHLITVPVGWTVRVDFTNRDRTEHSVVVVKDEGHPWVRSGGPALPGATSRAREAGLPPGGRDDRINFVARTPGAYLLVCGVAGHAAVGGYLRFVVSAEARVPSYTATRHVARPVAQPPARPHDRAPRA